MPRSGRSEAMLRQVCDDERGGGCTRFLDQRQFDGNVVKALYRAEEMQLREHVAALCRHVVIGDHQPQTAPEEEGRVGGRGI